MNDAETTTENVTTMPTYDEVLHATGRSGRGELRRSLESLAPGEVRELTRGTRETVYRVAAAAGLKGKFSTAVINDRVYYTRHIEG